MTKVLFLLIVSPLVSLIMRLMIDQIRSLNNRGVSAAILSSNKGIDKDLVATAKEVSSLLEDSFFVVPRVNLFYVLKTTPRSRPNTINTRPSRRPSVQLETDRPGVEANN